MRQNFSIILLSATLLGATVINPPEISSLMKPPLFKRVFENKEIMIHASLDDAKQVNGPAGLKKYSFYAAMRVGSSVNLSKQILTDYRLYAKMIPYVDKADYSKEDQTLTLEGGIWHFRLHSDVMFDQPSERWIHYTIVHGSFAGLQGDIFFESVGEKGTLIYLRGEQFGTHWPPQFVIERGAEIVFELAAQKMRSYIESQKMPDNGGANDPQERNAVPRPRSHI